MPELPEVETIRLGLQSHLPGRTIEKTVVGDSKVLQLAPGRLIKAVRGQTIQGLARRGKFLIFELDSHHLVFHLGMTGQLTFRDPRRPDATRFRRHAVTGLQRAVQHAPDKHTHLQIQFRQGGALLYRDIRKFGKVFLLAKNRNRLSAFLEKLGLEPFTKDYNLDAFLNRFGKRKLKVKSLLLDQHFVAGVGNIYADEALFEAGIHPSRTVRSLRRTEKERLFRAIPLVLKRGIQHGGTSLRDYVNSSGEPGNHQEELMVYGRRGESCYRCKSDIQKIAISQRGTHLCPLCQPRSGRR